MHRAALKQIRVKDKTYSKLRHRQEILRRETGYEISLFEVADAMLNDGLDRKGKK